MNPPQFIIIGAMKSATSTLHDQLALQQGIFMSTPKEPNFFSDDKQYQKGLGWYQSLFSDALPTDLCGESSTHYTKLPTYPETISRLKAYTDDIKLVYVLRHPLERLISHYIHEWSQNNIHCEINTAIKKHPELIEYSLYHKQISPFIENFGGESILISYFQKILHSPQAELEKVCRHIGYQDHPEWNFEMKSQNVSSQRIREFPLYSLLIKSRTASTLRKLLIPRSIREKIKIRLTMTERPTLTAETQNRLEAIFDRDLKRLNDMTGLDLNCNNFNSVTQNAA